MVTRSEAIERMAKAISLPDGAGVRMPGRADFKRAEEALDALLDYLEEVEERLIQDLEAANG